MVYWCHNYAARRDRCLPRVDCGNVGFCGYIHICNLRLRYGFCKHQTKQYAPLRFGGPGYRIPNRSVDYDCSGFDRIRLYRDTPHRIPQDPWADFGSLDPAPSPRLSYDLMAAWDNDRAIADHDSQASMQPSTLQVCWTNPQGLLDPRASQFTVPCFNPVPPMRV